jgi:hypothetical protein
MDEEDLQQLDKSQKPQKLDKSQKKYVSYVQLMDIETKEVFSKKATFVVLELPHFNKTENELQTEVDRWLYILKNMPDMNDLPEALHNEVFEEMFQMAEIAKLSKEDRQNYYNSLKSFRDMNNIIGYVYNMVEQRDKMIADLRQKETGWTQEKASWTQEKASWTQKEKSLTQEKASLTQENAELRRLLALKDKQDN